MKQEMPDFDVLLRLAQNDPEQLEQIRQQLTIEMIDSAPSYIRRRLRGLQFKIDSTRALAKTPMAACIQLTEMMHQSFEELRGALNSLHINSSPPPHEQMATCRAQIIPFPRRSS